MPTPATQRRFRQRPTLDLTTGFGAAAGSSFASAAISGPGRGRRRILVLIEDLAHRRDDGAYSSSGSDAEMVLHRWR